MSHLERKGNVYLNPNKQNRKAYCFNAILYSVGKMQYQWHNQCLNYTEVLVQNLAVESASQFYMEMHSKLHIYMYWAYSFNLSLNFLSLTVFKQNSQNLLEKYMAEKYTLNH